MLTHIKLTSFKGFQSLSQPLDQVTCFVGMNSKGKTTILQAIRLVFDFLDFAFLSPTNTDLARVRWNSNAAESLAKLSFNDPAAVWLKRNTQETCKIEASMGDLALLVEIQGVERYDLDILYRGESLRHSRDEETSKKVFGLREIKPLFAGPVGLVSPTEQLYPYQEMQQRIDQGRFSECWRSYLYWLYNDGKRREFDSVIELVQRHLPETRLFPPKLTHDSPPKVLVQFEEAETTLDISHSGGGLRTLLNLAVLMKFSQARCFLLDEPDTHLHGSLQRAVAKLLIEFADEHNVQVVCTSHAPDFIAQMPLKSLVWIDRLNTTGNNVSDLGEILVNLGSVTNTDAIRAYGADKILFVESGLDRDALRQLFEATSPNPFNDPTVLVAELPNGKGDSKHLQVLRGLLHASLVANFRIGAIVDNDYQLSASRSDSVTFPEILVEELPRKEIENYFIDPPVFAKAAEMAFSRLTREKTDNSFPSAEAVELKISEILNGVMPSLRSGQTFRKYLECQLAPRYEDTLPKELRDPQKRTESSTWFEGKWSDDAWRLHFCPGKLVLKALRTWAQNEYRLSISDADLCRACKGVGSDLEALMDRLHRFLYAEK